MAKRDFGVSMNGSPRPVTICTEPPVRQAESELVDVNKIMARYDKSGLVPFVDEQALYADVSSFGDYRDALDRAKRAEELFMQMPVRLRNRLENDPQRFIEFCLDEKNRAELVEFGLVAPAKPAEEPAVVEPAPKAEKSA